MTRIDRLPFKGRDGEPWTLKVIHAKPNRRSEREGHFDPRARELVVSTRGTTRDPLAILLHENGHELFRWMDEDEVTEAFDLLAERCRAAGVEWANAR